MLFSVGIVELAMYLRFVHAISYQRLSRLLLELFGLEISEGAFRRGKLHVDAEVAAILARLRHARVVCSDETSVRVDGRTCRNWVFQNDEVVIHVVRRSRGAGVVAEVLDGHRSAPGCPTSTARNRVMLRSGGSVWRPATRLHLCRRGWRRRVRTAHEGAAARRRTRAPKP